MAQSYYVRHETTACVATYENFSAVGTINQPYIEDIAVLGIFNEKESDSVLTVKKIEINAVQASTITTPNLINFHRTTAQSGGEVITPIKLDTNSASFPSQVSLAKYPASVTTTGAQYRNILGRYGFLPTTAFNAFVSPRIGKLKESLSNDIVYHNYESQTQGIVLREGEGLAITTNSSAPVNFPVEVSIKINIGSETYNITETINISSRSVLLGIFNGSGSGVVLTVAKIEVSEIRTADILPMFVLNTISGIYGGSAVSSVSMDTTNAAIPSGIKIVSNCVALKAQSDSSTAVRSRVSGDLSFRRVVLPSYSPRVTLTSNFGRFYDTKQIVFNFSPFIDSAGGFILREGEGLAIQNTPNASAFINYEVIVYFTNVYSPPTAGGSFTFIGG